MNGSDAPKRERSRHGAARALRQWSIARAIDAGLGMARWLPGGSIDRIERMIGKLGSRMPVVARMVEQNMRAAGVYSPAALKDYFANLAGHLAGGMHVWRFRDPGVTADSLPPKLSAEIRKRVELDTSIEAIHKLVARGQGVVLVGPHLCGYLFYLARLNEDVPLSAYLRPARVKRRRELHERWMRTVGLRRLVDPEKGANPTFVMAGAVRKGGVVYLTPDLPQKREEGVAVQFLKREIYLPGGLPLIARRAAAPIYFISARIDAGVCRLIAQGPYEAPPDSTRRSAGAQPAMQWFADQFARMLRNDPAVWYFWADKRWTRVFQGDPRYVRPLECGPVQVSADPSLES